jgi:hypothetical protein
MKDSALAVTEALNETERYTTDSHIHLGYGYNLVPLSEVGDLRPDSTNLKC